MKKQWWSPWAYEKRPWAALVMGSAIGAGALATAMVQGSWSGITTVVLAAGCVFCVYGAVILQMRKEYRRTSKWSRQNHGKSK